jgi:hypothetical protein
MKMEKPMDMKLGKEKNMINGVKVFNLKDIL